MADILHDLPQPETMLTYASILEKPRYWVDPRGQKWLLATGEIIEAACAALRYCAQFKSSAPVSRVPDALARLLHAVKTCDSYANPECGLAKIVAEFERAPAAPESGWLSHQLESAAEWAKEMPDWMTRTDRAPDATGEVKEVTVRAFTLAADVVRGMATAAAFARVWGSHSEAYHAAEISIREFANKARNGEEIRDHNGLAWPLASPPPAPCDGTPDEEAQRQINAIQALAATEEANAAGGVRGQGNTMMDFKAFQSCDPARAIFRAMGLLDYLESSTSWRALRALIVDYNDCDAGHFVKAARKYDGVCSSGERVLLHAILYVTDFAWLADELDAEGRGTWRQFDRVGGDHRRAVAACIGAEV